MTSEAKIESNRRNSLKSTGPRTPEGLARSSMNGLKHGLRSKKLALMREESLAFENRRLRWLAHSDPVDDMAEFLVHQNVCLSFEIERLERADLERRTALIENSESSALDDVHLLGQRLLFDPAGPKSLRVDGAKSRGKLPPSSHPSADSDDPAVLVRRLESTEAGCRWLLERWHELHAQLEPASSWQSHDRLKLIQLLGRRLGEARSDRLVAQILAASHALEPLAETNPFHDLLDEVPEFAKDRAQTVESNSQNPTTEAKSPENALTVQNGAPIAVAANSRLGSPLDKRVEPPCGAQGRQSAGRAAPRLGRRRRRGPIPEEALSRLNPCRPPDRHRQEPHSSLHPL
jgi:hypothetical protein